MDHSLLRDSTVYYQVPPCPISPDYQPGLAQPKSKAAPPAHQHRAQTPPLSRAEQMPINPKAKGSGRPRSSAAQSSIPHSTPLPELTPAQVIMEAYEFSRGQLDHHPEPQVVTEARNVLAMYLGLPLDTPSPVGVKRPSEEEQVQHMQTDLTTEQQLLVRQNQMQAILQEMERLQSEVDAQRQPASPSVQ
jgi:hypothetical protein